MDVTRRRFGIMFLVGIAAVLFGGIMKLFHFENKQKTTNHARARFWKRADHLAG